MTATVAGVGLLALATPAQAGVVYEVLNDSVPPEPVSIYNLWAFGGAAVVQIGNDRRDILGTDYAELRIAYDTSGFGWSSGVITPTCFGRRDFAAGELVGPGLCSSTNLKPTMAYSSGFGVVAVDNAIGDGLFFGLWFTNGNLYPNPEDHYGWVRMNVHRNGLEISAEVVDWAYQTTPWLPIAAGDTGVPEPSSLAMLALGTAGLAAIRARRRCSTT